MWVLLRIFQYPCDVEPVDSAASISQVLFGVDIKRQHHALAALVSAPEVLVSEVQGPHSMKLLANLLDGQMPEP